MLGVFVNTIAVLCGSIIGLLFSRLIPDNLSDFIMKGIGLCTMYIGISGMLSGSNPLVTIISIVIGAILGSGLRIEDGINHLAGKLQSRFARPGEKKSIAEGFVSACLLFCIGSMTILGSFEGARNGSGPLDLNCHTTLLIKSLLDLVSSTCLAATYGVSVMASAAFVLVFQGGLTLLASAVQNFLNSVNALPMVNCVGSLILLAIAMNLLGVKKTKTADYLPAILLPILICWVLSLAGVRV
jgi:uncharacterized membrane protein YqgA involved in biofilm formation